ncbi:MAG: DUF3307 domain-containing protein, partial [Gammaproteobacteria bacterium]
MFWALLLCHFVADYPLQSKAVVQAKTRLPGLIWHVTIHLITMLVVILGLLGSDWSVALPAILTLTGFHFVIDLWKNILSRLRPGWVIFSYLQDQVLHFLSILAIAYWAEQSGGPSLFLNETLWIVPMIGFVSVTHAWFITERILTYRNQLYQQWLNEQSWSRMVGRAAMFSAWFAGWSFWGLLIVLGGLAYHWLDLAGVYRLRALATDGCVVAVVMVL